MKKVELLAPAGSFQALKGAIAAGADAIYLGGQQYGARAYADNFSKEEICRGIHLAHVFGRKIYLTVNTLVKEKELDLLYDFLLPFYESGLDGVIVQDLGALRLIRDCFPDLSLHASTQMSLTGYRGADLLQKEGVSRIVPARELSLEEIKRIKEYTGIEIESFIHGAMCYCYSGQCLFSSILGGRSGNRGRCAQPCRLPYRTEEGRGECYPLSMKDMCTLEMLPELIEAGIDSFKIEGRMKRPEYSAGVTAIYRKYMDLYYEKPEDYRIDPKDKSRLHSLYIRSGTGEGYYHRRNGKEMITLDSPAYLETDAGLLKAIEEEYLNSQMTIPVQAVITLKPGCKAELSLECEQTFAAVSGDIVQEALKQPLSEEKIISQVKKSGNSLLDIREVKVNCTDEVFMPVGALNELRRQAVAAMEAEFIKNNGLAYENRCGVMPQRANTVDKPQSTKANASGKTQNTKWRLHATVLTKQQLLAALQMQTERIYVDYRLLMEEGLIAMAALLQSKKTEGQEFFVSAPYVSRADAGEYLLKIMQAVKSGIFQGVLVRNLESFGYFRECLTPEQMILDAGIYVWNRESIRFFDKRASGFCLPVECNAGEWRGLLALNENLEPSALVYGRLPMMITAGCIARTEGKCRKASGIIMLKDRYEKVFPVYHDCLSCYNVIYNSVPLSLHRMFQDRMSPVCCRLDFTVENSEETVKIINYFRQLASGEYREPVYEQYTTGHYKRGVD